MASGNGLSYRTLTEDDHANVVRFIQQHFIPHEPLVILAGIRAEEEKNFPHILIKNSLWQKASIGVFDNSNGELIAVRINLLGKHMKTLPYEDNSEKHSRKLQTVQRILSHAKEGTDEYIPNENYMEHEFVVVNQAYGRRGIATELYRRSEILARQHGCEKMRVTCSSHYTRRSVEKVGYVAVKEFLYANYKDVASDINPFENMPAPHTSVAVLMKDVGTE